MTEALSVVRYRSGKGCADGDALRKTADTRCLRLSLLDAQKKDLNPRSSLIPDS
jgi:hypothetical protein